MSTKSFDRDGWLNSQHTKQLLSLLNKARKCGGSFDPFDGGQVFYSTEEIKKLLETREHVPNKKEAREIRQSKAKNKKSKKL